MKEKLISNCFSRFSAQIRPARSRRIAPVAASRDTYVKSAGWRLGRMAAFPGI